MAETKAFVSQRRSYNGDLCTVRYVGTVEGTKGEWLGVEWDDPTRGKHSGQHQGVTYFTCKNKQPTAGSFVRPSRQPDPPRGFLEALREKYASEFEEVLARQQLNDAVSDDPLQKPIEISGKVVEEVGFDKIRKQLAELQELKIVLLDGLRVAGLLAREVPPEQEEAALREIEQTCPKIVELDLSRGLIDRWGEVWRICSRLEKLKKLRLNGNRFRPVQKELRFERIAELHVDDTLLSWEEVTSLSYQFPSLTTLSASSNQLSTLSTPLTSTITYLSLEHNSLTTLSSIRTLSSLPNLAHLSLRGNSISQVHDTPDELPMQFTPNLKSLDISRNNINTWTFINHLSTIFPGLQSLRISGNPLFNQPVGPTAVTGMPEAPMTVDEAYMLTLARLSTLQILNYGAITEKDRTNGELYYLSLIGKELSTSPIEAEESILATHPRYTELCNLHGEPVISRSGATGPSAVNPRSVAARLVRMVFRLRGTVDENQKDVDIVKVKEIPRSFDTYQVKAVVGRLFGLTPFEFRLIWETDELDPVNEVNVEADDGWDSEDEIGEDSNESSGGGFVKREVELVDTTKDIGFWFQADIVEARVRVECPSRV